MAEKPAERQGDVSTPEVTHLVTVSLIVQRLVVAACIFCLLKSVSDFEICIQVSRGYL